MIDALIEQAPSDYAFRLYFNRFPISEIINQRSEIRLIPFPRLWTHVRLSLEMLLHRPDLLFVPAHVLPLIPPRLSVVTVHDLGYLHFPQAHPGRQRWYLDRSTRWNVRVAAHIFADSETTKRDLIERYRAKPDQISVAYPGLDPKIHPVEDQNEIARVKAKHHINDDYLLYLGTLQPRKNLSRLITAFSQLLSSLQSPVSNRSPRGGRGRGLQVLNAGQPGWYGTTLFQQVKALGFSERVLFPGYVEASDKPALLSGARAFVFPSLYEGFGFPVLEAMMCGTPVLCSNTSSLPEVAGGAALQVDPLDVESIARGLMRITQDEHLREQLIERGYLQAQRFTWRACADVALGVFDRLLIST